MTNRIFKSIFTVAAAALLVCFALVTYILYGYFGAQFKTGLQNEIGYIAQGVEHEGLGYFADIQPGSSRVTWIAADGTVLYDSQAEASTLENHAGRQEVKAAMENGAGESTRYSATLSQKSYYYAERLKDGTIIRVSSARQAMWVLLLRMLQPILCVLAAALILSAVTASRVAKRVIAPINGIDLEHPDMGEAYEELAPLLSRLHYQSGVIEKQMRDLQARQTEFKAITENMSEGFLVIDHQTNLLSYNAAALRILEAEKPEDTVSALALNRAEPFRKAVSEALGGSHSTGMLELHGRHYQLIANPVQQEAGPTGAVMVILDVTEKEERENMRREFTANVSHELKTPLTSISSVAEVMKDGLVRQEDIPHFALTIYNEAQRLIQLISDIIKLSQLDEQAVPLDREKVDLYAMAQSILERLGDEAAAGGVHVELTGGHVQVNGVARVLDEMLYNLCDNAIKYNKKGGAVTVLVEEKAGRPAVTVRDTGIGIPAEHQERVFERFYRVDKSHSKEIGGTGLGLSIVKHGAAYHNARVYLESEPGVGTSVSILF